MKTTKAALIPLLATIAAWPLAAANDAGLAGAGSAPSPESRKKAEVVRYTTITADGRRIPAGKTVTTYEPNRRAFDDEVADSVRRQQSLPGQKARKIVRDTFTDGRPPTTRVVHPSDYAARR